MIMIKSVIFLLLGLNTSVINAEVLIDSSDQCGKKYDLSSTERVEIRLKGGWNTTKHCAILFVNDVTSDYDLCVKPLSLNLDCITVIEYHKYFVAKYRYMYDGILNCDDNNHTYYEDNCFKFVAKFYIVIKKKETYTSNKMGFKAHESARIQVYRRFKETEGTFQEERSERAASVFLVVVSVSVIMIAVMLTCRMCFGHKINYKKLSNTCISESKSNQQEKCLDQQEMAQCTQSTASDPTSGSIHNQSDTVPNTCTSESKSNQQEKSLDQQEMAQGTQSTDSDRSNQRLYP
ncbi:hypothetical protein ACF0H5_015032 [Mactra antiquata]